MRFSARTVRAIRLLLKPIADVLASFGNPVTPSRPRTANFSSEEQLLSTVDEATESDVLEEDDRELIHSIYDFSDAVGREVMVPRTDTVTIDGDATMGAAKGLFLRRGGSREPVIGEDIAGVFGVRYRSEVARVVDEHTLDADTLTTEKLAGPAIVVPESKKADPLMRHTQLESNRLTMVVDEHGGIAGLVNLENLIEELVGDIADEYDRQMPEIEDLGHGKYRVSARLSIDELGDVFGIESQDDEVDSVGGLLARVHGRLLVVGSRAEFSGLILEAERTEGCRRHLSTVLVERDQPLIDVQAAFAGTERSVA